MNEFDPKKIEELLSQNKAEEAKLYIQSFAKKDMSDAEKAAIHFDFALLYLRVMNAVKEQRNSALRGILSDLQLINKTEKELGEQVKIAEVRSKLRK